MVGDDAIRCVAVFGGTGYLGGEIVRRLAGGGLNVRVAARRPDKYAEKKRADVTGTVEPVYADIRDETSVTLALGGCDAVVNAVGLYVEHGNETFEAVHELGALNVAHQCTLQGIGRLIHISGIGADMTSKSKYVRSRAKGELLVKDVLSATTILRPSVLFGASDRFINTLAKIVRSAPVVPLFGDGRTKLQAVFVGDVAEAVLSALRDPSSRQCTYELGGPRAYAYRELFELLFERLNKRRPLLPLPFRLWDLAASAASVLSNPPLTRDQVALMEKDNVVGENALTLADLDIAATALEDILPRYRF